MSDVVEKTLSALPGLFDSQTGAARITSRLRQLVKSITELTSKHEEESLIKQELSSMKEQVSSPNTSMKQMREIMVRAMYCEMLGYDASFTYIHAIKLAQQGGVLEKRVGYLAVSLFLNEGHELLLLLVNTVLKDLQSTNVIEAYMALTVVAQVFPKDMIPAVLPLLEDKLSEIIRRKAVLALYKFYLIAPNQVQHIHAKFRKALCDRDPGVMTSSLHIYLQLITESPDDYKDLTGSFVTILKQVVDGKLPVDFNYHNVPAPWLQIQLLRILSLLGKEDRSTSELMYEVLDESLRRAEMNHNITYAILYECVKAIYTIHPKAELLEKAARCIGNFVLSPKINLRYLGLKALTYVVQHDAKLALQHQMTIIECLDHTDFTIKRETLELLFRITNAQNVTVIVEKMLDFLHVYEQCTTSYKMNVRCYVPMITLTFAPDNSWFIQTMNDVFSTGGDLLQQDVPNNFLRLLAEGKREEDDQLRLYAVNSYLTVLNGDASHLPQRFLQVMSWVCTTTHTHTHTHTHTQNKNSAMRLIQILVRDLKKSYLLNISVRLYSNFKYHFSSSTLILEGVKRVWGRDGYLRQNETTAPPVDEPSAAVQPSGQQEAAERLEPQPEPSTQNQDKLQLASSLFVGLGAGSSMSLLGKSEAPPPRFRKKPRPHESSSSSSSGTSERSSDSSSRSSHSTTDSFLYGSLLEEEPATSISAFSHTPKSSTANGLAQNKDTKEDRRANTSQILGGDMVIVRPNTFQDKHPSLVSSDLTALLPADLKDLPHSDVISLTSDPSLSLSSCRLFRDEALLLVILISNCTETVIKDVAVQLTCEELEVCHKIFLEYVTLEHRSSVKSLWYIYSFFSVTHRPLVVSTEEYGKLWLSLSHDVKQNLKLLTDASDPLRTTLNALKDALQLHVVDIIGSEGIVACRLLSGAPCLLHCRVNGAALAMWLRSPHPALPDCILYHCQRALAQH
uniref:AP-4 complex subunit epsilon n=1 Tax=Cyprinus carpio TaxID=7962 RepID=A0A8C1JVN5_CYPCA